MRITEKKLRRVIRSVIAESQHASGVMTAKDCLEEIVDTGIVGVGGIESPILFSKVCEMCKPDGVSMDGVLSAIIDNPRDYKLQGCMVHFLNANPGGEMTPEDEKLMRDLNDRYSSNPSPSRRR